MVVTTIVVVEPLNSPLAPLNGAVNVTFTPATGALLEFVTVTDGAVKKAVLIGALCGVVPGFAVIVPDALAVLVSEKFTVGNPGTAAVTIYGPPTVPLAAKKGAIATPELLVATVIVAVVLLNNPLAPVVGAVKVTFTPATGLLPASSTVTDSAVGKDSRILALCATMKSGMLTPPDEGPLFGDLWSYLNTYLAQPLVGTPGVTYSYNNENFTILQGVIDQVTGQDYVTWVTQNVLVPAGVDPSIFNPNPDPSSTATLLYGGPSDARDGDYFGPLDFVAPGGFISTAQELLKIPLALRNTSVIPAAAISEMLNDGIGWFSYAGNFGTYYQKDGGLHSGATPPQTLNTCIVRLAEGYDIALVANTQPPIDVVNICAGAFDSRGLLVTDLPPAISTVLGAATLLPKAAAAYCSIKGFGFTDQAATDWSSSITSSALPTSIGGISVSVNGQPSYVQYISATQVNFLVPSSAAAGIADVDLITPTGAMSSTIEIDAVAPGLFCYTLKGVLYPSSVYATGNGVVYVAAAGALPGYASRPAAAGDIIELYATGCGPTNPAAPDGVVLSQAYRAANLAAFQVTIAGKTTFVLFAGLVNPGLWQLNVQIPTGLIGGDQPLVLSVNNVASQANVMITVLGG
ncbi:MAG TPA: serine hydrolase [Bryobacteraceae bacterium]